VPEYENDIQRINEQLTHNTRINEAGKLLMMYGNKKKKEYGDTERGIPASNVFI